MIRHFCYEDGFRVGPIAVTFSRPGAATVCGRTSEKDNVATIEFLSLAGRDHRMQ